MRKWLLLGFVMFSMPARAEDVSVHTFCQMVPQHVPDASVNYQPGVDARGRSVVSADINKVLKDDFDAVDIPVEYNVLNGLGVNLPPGSQAQPLVAMVRIYRDGRVQYNGNDLTAQAETLCSNTSRATIVTGQAQGQGPFYPNREPKVLGQLNADGTAVKASP